MAADQPDPQDFLHALEAARELASNLNAMKQQFIELGWSNINAERAVVALVEGANR